MSNARIQFSTASEEKWLQVNPVLREGELVIARKANGKRKLVVGKPGGSSYANSEVVWDAEQAESYMNTTKDLSENVNVFVPHIDSSGILTWTNKAGLDNPSPITIKGIKGDPGEKGEPGQRGEQGAQGIQGPRGIQGEQGERGVQGAQGPAGNAATITIGNVTTSAPGTSASVTNRGTSSAAVFDFVLPKGKDGADGGVTVDTELSSTSTNPVQNKVIYSALEDKMNTKDIISGFALLGGATNIRWREGTQFIGSINAANYSGTARTATHDGAGNIISETYAKKTDVSGMVKSVNNIKPDSNGNVTITVSGGSNVTVDTTLSATSTNPIANKTVYSALGGKLGKTETAYAATKATQDGNGNVISSTYIKSVNNVTPDENGNVNITVSGGGSNITVDAKLSATSTNPVQNKVIKGALDDKADLNKNNTFSKENYFQKGMSLIAYRDLDSAIKWYQSTANPPIASIDATTYTGTAAKATSDGAGNVITETYAKKTDISGVVKSVNGTKPDASGNVTVAVSGGGGVSTSESNTWTAQQNFRDLMLNREKYTTYVVNGTSDTPVTSTMVYAVTGAFTLNLATLAGALKASESSVFTAYFAANADYSLTINNAGKLKYVGSASDVAITSSGLLLNIWMSKDGGGTLTSIVQANKLA